MTIVKERAWYVPKHIYVITELTLRKRLDYRGVGWEKGRSIHSYMEIVVEGILLFSNTIFKVSTHIQITVISTLIHKQNRCQGPPSPLSPPDRQHLQNFTDITQVQNPPNLLKPPNKRNKMCRILHTGCTKLQVSLPSKSCFICMRQLHWERGLCTALQ